MQPLISVHFILQKQADIFCCSGIFLFWIFFCFGTSHTFFLFSPFSMPISEVWTLKQIFKAVECVNLVNPFTNLKRQTIPLHTWKEISGERLDRSFDKMCRSDRLLEVSIKQIENNSLLAHDVTRNLCKNAFKNPKFKFQCVQRFFWKYILCFLKSCKKLKNSAYFVYKDCSM